MACSAQQKQHLINLKLQYTALSNLVLKYATTGVKEYTIGDRTFEYNSYEQMSTALTKLNGEICQYEAGRGPRTQQIIPLCQ